MLKAIIVDDEQPARLRIKKLLEKHEETIFVAGEADCGQDAISIIQQLKPDVLFLDIHMPDMSGFEVLAQLTFQPLIIFTTAYAEYAIKAFEEMSIDYLVKPIKSVRFDQAIQKLLLLSEEPKQSDLKALEAAITALQKPVIGTTFPIKKKDKIILVEFENISHFKAEDKYVKVVLKDCKSHLINNTITELTKQLPPYFIQVHRSTIINRNFIVEIEKYFKGRLVLKLKDHCKSSITTGETYSKKVKEVMGI